MMEQNFSLHNAKIMVAKGGVKAGSCPHCPQGYPQEKPKIPLRHECRRGKSTEILPVSTKSRKMRFGLQNNG